MKRAQVIRELKESANLDETFDYECYQQGWNEAVYFAIELLEGVYDKPLSFPLVLPPYDDGIVKGN